MNPNRHGTVIRYKNFANGNTFLRLWQTNRRDTSKACELYITDKRGTNKRLVVGTREEMEQLFGEAERYRRLNLLVNMETYITPQHPVSLKTKSANHLGWLWDCQTLHLRAS